MRSPLRYSPPVERKATLLCVKSKNSKEHQSKFRAQKRRAVVRVDTEETQDHVSKRFTYDDLNQEEADEIGFVPGALSEP